MEHHYAIAMVTWEGADRTAAEPLGGDCVYKPAEFPAHGGGWWTLAVLLPPIVRTGDRLLLPVSAVMPDVPEGLLAEGAVFALKEGPKTIATGRVDRVGTFPLAPDEPLLEALRRELNAAGLGLASAPD
jgi:hypothetical protein